MYFHDVIDNHFQNIHDIFQQGIQIGVDHIYKMTTKPQEPDIVAGIVCESTPYWSKELSTLFSKSGISFSIFSIYCH